MGASRYVGRVGGLAVALGVGAAMFSGSGLAWADTGTAGADSTGTSNANGTSASQSTPARRTGVRGVKGAAKTNNRQSAAPAATASKKAPVASVARRVAALSISAPASAVADSVVIDTTPADSSDPVVDEPSPLVDPVVVADTGQELPPEPDPESSPEPSPAPEIGPIMYTLSPGDDEVSDGAGTDPQPLADSPASWALLAATRRHAVSTTIRNAPAAQTTTALATPGSNSAISDNPTVDWVDGVLIGSVNAVCEVCGSSPLTYTVISGPNLGGKLNFNINPDGSDPGTGEFSYLPYATSLYTPGTAEEFRILVNSTTALVQFLTGIPLLGSFVSPVVQILYRTPILGDLLSPLIGYSTVANFSEVANTIAAGKNATAFTDKVTSFDGVKISVNYFPSIAVANGTPSTQSFTILDAPGLASPGETNPNGIGISGTVPGLATLRAYVDAANPGFNTLSFDPRGEFNSGGVLQLDSPFYEAQDITAIISWLSSAGNVDGVNNPASAQVKTGADVGRYTDPAVVGMVGLSYGGGIQNVSAATDPRIKAIVPAWSWNSLNSSLYPNGAFKTAYGSLLLLSLVTTGARINNQIYLATLLGDTLGLLTPSQQAVIRSSGPGPLINNITVPTLYLQGTDDVLFPLPEAVANAQALAANGVTTKMIWTCIGHGECLPKEDLAEQSRLNVGSTMAWLAQYVAGTSGAADLIPTFAWFDQTDTGYYSPLLPSDENFNGDVVTESDPGGHLFIVPVLGGSNAPKQGTLPYSLGEGSPAANAISVTVDVPVGDHIAGAPAVSFDYSGRGTSRFLFGQVVDTSTGVVLGTLVTPIPVTLNGKSQTASISLSDIAWTSTAAVGNTPADTQLEVQLTTSASAYWNFTSFGSINISNVSVGLPIVDPANANLLP